MRIQLIFLLSLAAIPVPIRATNPNPIVAVTGGKIRGTFLEPGGATFKGVPYAHPPVGEFRWREPAPVEPWTGVREVTLDGPPCAQTPILFMMLTRPAKKIAFTSMSGHRHGLRNPPAKR